MNLAGALTFCWLLGRPEKSGFRGFRVLWVGFETFRVCGLGLRRTWGLGVLGF